MSLPDVEKAVRARLALPPQLPNANPTKSSWQEPEHPTIATIQSPELPAEADIVIIGSGITGCSVAHTLLSHPAAAGLRILLLEARTAVSGATGRNGGHLVSDSLSLMPYLLEAYGAEQTAEVARFSERNITTLTDLVAQLEPTARKAVQFRQVSSVTGLGEAEAFHSLQRGIDTLNELVPESKLAHELVSCEAATEKYKLHNIAGAVSQHGVAALWPYRLITAVLESLVGKYSDHFAIETNTPVVSISYGPRDTSSISEAYTLTTPRGKIITKKIIHCTNAFSANLIPNLVGKLYPIRGTMSQQRLSPSFPRLGGEVSWSYFGKPSYDPSSQLWSTGLYYAQQNEETGDLWIGGEVQKLDDMLTSDDSAIGESAKKNICSIVPSLFKDCDPVEPVNVWSGILGFTADGLPLVGKLPEQLSARTGKDEWIAAGFNGHGMDKCWHCGEAVARMALGEDAPTWLPRIFLLDEKRCEDLTLDKTVQGFLSTFIQ